MSGKKQAEASLCRCGQATACPHRQRLAHPMDSLFFRGLQLGYFAVDLLNQAVKAVSLQN